MIIKLFITGHTKGNKHMEVSIIIFILLYALGYVMSNTKKK